MGHLYFGDNLDILRNHIKDESVNLIYLDPPFNSKRDYNLLFKTPKGHVSDAQVTAFDDSWHWGEQAEREFDEIIHSHNSKIAEIMQALRHFLGENDMMAYLVMMCNRLLELRRILKSTGSLYLHCDPTASHYLKIVLDGVFGKENYRNEIVWKRTGAHSGAKKYAPVHDVLFYYSKTDSPVWNSPRVDYTEEYLNKYYKYDDGDGRLYWRNSLTAAGVRTGSSGQNWRGYSPSSQGSHWKFTVENLDELDAKGLIYWPPNGGWPQIKRYRDDLKGVVVNDFWDDIDKINPSANERLGYPTQKPLALLERIIKASSNPGDILLDPFCGCGTAVHAAQKLEREWIGIDITHLAISIIEERLRKHFPGVKFETHGTPKDLEGARELAKRDKYEFQWWVCHLVNAQPYQNKKKGADGGIDGIIYFQDVGNLHKKAIVSVKGGEHVNPSMIRDLGHVVEREKAQIGIFVTLTSPSRPMKEEAAKVGFYAPPFVGAKFPKIQILTIDGLLNGTEQALYPDLARGGYKPRKKGREESKQMPLLLPYEGKKKDTPVTSKKVIAASNEQMVSDQKRKEARG